MNKGYVTIHLDIEKNKFYCSEIPYKTLREAKHSLPRKYNIESVGVFEVEYKSELK
jgi:hypothetical protein